MVKHTGLLCLVCGGLALATACDPDRGSTAVITIDMRCSSRADCPIGFACAEEAEHGPPTTLCEADDPAVECPPGYDTKVRYGQRFCKPRRDVADRGPLGAVSAGAGASLASRAGDGPRAR